MIYDKITKGDDGLRHVRAFSDERKRNFLQLEDVKIVDISHDFVFESSCSKPFDELQETNVANAVVNSEEWFGRALSEQTLRRAYSREGAISAERLDTTKVFNSKKEVVDYDTLKEDMNCSVVVEFSGLWFAKKAFGPTYNIVQVKLHPDPDPDPEKDENNFDESYPEDYMFEDRE